MNKNTEITFRQWKIKVDHYIRYLIGYDTYQLDMFLYRQYYDFGFTPKVVAFLSVKSRDTTINHYLNFQIWEHEVYKYLSLFLSQTEIDKIEKRYLKNLYYDGLSPIIISETYLTEMGHLPIEPAQTSLLSSSPPKI